MNQDICPICLENLGDNITTTNCNHQFCDSCFKGLMDSNKIECPLCRGVIKEYTTFNYNGEIYNKENMLTLIEMFKNSNINITNFQSLESGSRRIDLLMVGFINETQFTQSMTICHLNDTWFIKNSVILI